MKKFCTNCGSELKEDQDVCLNCGKAVKGSTSNSDNTAKSKVAAGLLGILLGSLGIHNFYLGYTGKGLAQLLMSVLSCGFLAAVSSIWGLIEGIMILTGGISTDANGNPLKD